MERASPFSFSDRLYVLILRKRGERGRESSEIERKNRREPVKLKGFEVGKMMVLNYTLCVGCNFAQKRNITKQFYYLRKETLFFHNIFHRAKLWQIATCLWLLCFCAASSQYVQALNEFHILSETSSTFTLLQKSKKGEYSNYACQLGKTTELFKLVITIDCGS